MSKELQQFYNELWIWIQAGCPEHRFFQNDNGICANLDYWSDSNWRLSNELEDQFYDEGFDVFYPFGIITYYDEVYSSTIFENADRLDWIKKHVNISVD